MLLNYLTLLALLVGLAAALVYGRRFAVTNRRRRRTNAWEAFARGRGYERDGDGRMVRSLAFGESILEQIDPEASRFDDFRVRAIARLNVPIDVPPTRFGLGDLHGDLRQQAGVFFGPSLSGVWDGAEVRTEVQVADRLRRVDAAVAVTEAWLDLVRQRRSAGGYR